MLQYQRRYDIARRLDGCPARRRCDPDAGLALPIQALLEA
jgi:hypothetical protein